VHAEKPENRDAQGLRGRGAPISPRLLAWRLTPFARSGRDARWACHLAGACSRPCPLRKGLFVVNDRHHPRPSHDAPDGSRAWETLYPRRTKNLGARNPAPLGYAALHTKSLATFRIRSSTAKYHKYSRMSECDGEFGRMSGWEEDIDFK